MKGIVIRMVEFVNYDGRYPNLCSGVLTVRINGEIISLPPHSLESGGCVSFNKDWEEEITEGAWTIDKYRLPENLLPYVDEIEKIANDNIPWGCCGGCV